MSRGDSEANSPDLESEKGGKGKEKEEEKGEEREEDKGKEKEKEREVLVEEFDDYEGTLSGFDEFEVIFCSWCSCYRFPP